ncbi:hypothetical protein MRX96_040148 [Rhipicephalus microplus]
MRKNRRPPKTSFSSSNSAASTAIRFSNSSVAILRRSPVIQITASWRLSTVAVICRPNDTVASLRTVAVQDRSLTVLPVSCVKATDCSKIHLRTSVSYVPPNGLRRLMATCPNLHSLSILDRGASFCFLREASCPKAGHLTKLERLSLMADRSLHVMGLEERDLRLTVDALRALVSIAIYSFEAHLFLADYAPHLELAWSACVACEVKFPQWNKEHADLWSQVNKGPVE